MLFRSEALAEEIVAAEEEAEVLQARMQEAGIDRAFSGDAQAEADKHDPANLDNKAQTTETQVPETTEQPEVKPSQSVRGSLASAVTKQSTVKTPTTRTTRQSGLKRI